MTKVLIPVTNHATLGETDKPNGTYLPEITHVIDVLTAADIDYTIASLKGGKAPLYGTDVENDKVNEAVLNDTKFQACIHETLPVTEVNIEDYDTLFYPGGYGLLNDLAIENNAFAELAAYHYERGGIIADVCHGPAALLPIKLNTGEWLLSTKSVTSFTREEEIEADTINDIPFLLEEALCHKAGSFAFL